MTIQEELKHLPKLAATGQALVDFAQSLCPIGAFQFERTQWIFRPQNFVTVKVRYKRVYCIELSLWGDSRDFRQMKHNAVLEVKDGFRSYARAKVDNPRQLKAAAVFIETAFENYSARYPLAKNAKGPSCAPADVFAKPMRLNLLAMDLGVESKTIIEKLRVEGFGDKVPNHMSTLPMELVLKVHEWFNDCTCK